MSLIEQAQQIRKRLHSADQEAQDQAGALRSLKEPTAQQVYPYLRNYIRSKYLLTPADMDHDNLEELGRRSLARVAALGGNVPGMDVSPHCGSASSATHKKVLLLLALRRDLEIDIPAAQGAHCETVMQLAQCISGRLKKDNG